MEKIYLTVAYAEKDEAKSLGARWDGGAKKWYAPTPEAASKLAKWLPPGFEMPSSTGNSDSEIPF